MNQDAGFALQVKRSWQCRRQIVCWFQSCKIFTKRPAAPPERNHPHQILKKTGMQKITSFPLTLHRATEMSINCMLFETRKSNSAPLCICIMILPNSVITHLFSHKTFVFQESGKFCWIVGSGRIWIQILLERASLQGNQKLYSNFWPQVRMPLDLVQWIWSIHLDLS